MLDTAKNVDIKGVITVTRVQEVKQFQRNHVKNGVFKNYNLVLEYLVILVNNNIVIFPERQFIMRNFHEKFLFLHCFNRLAFRIITTYTYSLLQI